MSEFIDKFNLDGYVIIDLDDGEVDFSLIINDMDNINSGTDKKLNPKIYHYNEYPRLIEAWRKSDNIKRLALHPKIMSALRDLYKSEPVAFSTINFTKGTEQPLHSDYFHLPQIALRNKGGYQSPRLLVHLFDALHGRCSQEILLNLAFHLCHHLRTFGRCR